MQKTDGVYRRIMTWFLFLNPILDIVSGLYITLYQMGGEKFALLKTPVTPSLVIRLVMLLFMLVYLAVKRDKKAWLTLIPMGVCCALTVVTELLFAESFSLYLEVQYLAKFAFNVVLLLAYMAYFRDSDSRESVMRFLDRLVNYTLLVLTGVLMVCYVFGFGYSTYGDRFGFFGFRGIYYSGNDITGVFMILLPLSLRQALESDSLKKSEFLKALIPAMTVNSLLIIGTKTAFIACAASVLGVMIYAVVRLFKKDRKIAKNFAIVLLVIAVMFGLLMLFSGSGIAREIGRSIGHTGKHLQESQGDIGAVALSGRQHKLRDAFEVWRAGGVRTWLLGIGRGTRESVIEMDVFEVLFYYGILGAAAMLWLYVKLGVSFLKSFFKKVDLGGLCLFLSVGMTTAYLIMAGHVLFSTTSGGYYALSLLYARAYYSSRPEELRI